MALVDLLYHRVAKIVTRGLYLRLETLTQANAALVDYQATIPLAQEWGGGEVASADGLRFVVPVRTSSTIRARYSGGYEY